MLACPDPPLPERRSRPHPNQTLKCPRCSSSDTKFCYYNNYSMTQPRYFCKNCKRYWTDGGALRNVPVGGGLRKNKKSKPKTSSTSSSSSTDLHSIHVTGTTTDDHHKFSESHYIQKYCPSLRSSGGNQGTSYGHRISGGGSGEQVAPSENLRSFMPELCNHVGKGTAQCAAAGYEKLYGYVGLAAMEQTPPNFDLHDIFVSDEQPVANLLVQGSSSRDRERTQEPDRQVCSGVLLDSSNGAGMHGDYVGANYTFDWVQLASERLFEGIGDFFYLQHQGSEIAGGALGVRSNQNWPQF